MSAPTMKNPSFAGVAAAAAALLLAACAPAPVVPAPMAAASAAPLVAGADAPPLPGAPRPLKIEAPIEQRLPNGVRVVLAARPGVQVVTAELVVLAGSEFDPAERAGLATLTAGLLTKGTKKHSATALARAAESLGGALESGAGWHQSSVGITVTTPRLDEALALVAEAVEQPTFAPAEIDRLRAQSLDDLKVAYSQPGTLAARAAQRMLFGAGVYGHPAGGTPQSLARITRADLVALHAASYRPENAVLVLAGDVDAATALRLATRHFGAWKAAARTPAAEPAAAIGTPLPGAFTLIDMPGSGQAAVVVTSPIPPLGDQRATAAVMNSVLGAGYSSRLNQEIRIKRGLSYGAGSSLDARRQGGALRIGVQTKNESAAEVLGLVQGELDRMAAAPVGTDELAARKATLIGDFSRSVETTAGLEASLRSLIVAGVPLEDLQTRIEKLGAVSAADVQAYAAAHFGAAGRRVAVAGDAAKFGPEMKTAAPGALELKAEALDLERVDGLRRPPASGAAKSSR